MVGVHWGRGRGGGDEGGSQRGKEGRKELTRDSMSR